MRYSLKASKFQFLIVRLKFLRTFTDCVELLLFQFLIVRLKLDLINISDFNSAVSIPYSTIKIRACAPHVAAELVFQFLIVRLKCKVRHIDEPSLETVSIPYSTIKISLSSSHW